MRVIRVVSFTCFIYGRVTKIIYARVYVWGSKEVWNILQTTYWGTQVVKNSKLQMLTAKFEEIMMNDDKTFDDFLCEFE